MKVVYHANCADGFMSAFLLYQAYKEDKPEFFPAQYGDGLPDAKYDPNEWVYVVDFSYPPELIKELAAKVGYVVMLDHHETAKSSFVGWDISNVMALFDMTQSGAMLTYTYLHLREKDVDLSQWAALTTYIQDRDLWQWRLPNSREVSAAIASYPKTFEVWEKFVIADLIQEGGAILRYQTQVVDGLVKLKSERFLTKIKSPSGTDLSLIVQAVNSPILQSEIGERLAKEFGIGLVWFINEKGERINSLRSLPGGINVAEIAKVYGGGGHAAAAGFKGDL